MKLIRYEARECIINDVRIGLGGQIGGIVRDKTWKRIMVEVSIVIELQIIIFVYMDIAYMDII